MTAEIDASCVGKALSPNVLQPARRGAMPPDEIVDVQPGNPAVFDNPSAADHHPIRLVGAAEHESGERIAVTGEAEFVELEQRKVGDLAFLDLAERGTTDASRRPHRGPTERVAMTDLGDAVSRPLQQE